MSKDLAQWLLKQIGDQKKELAKQTTLNQRTGRLGTWHGRPLEIEGATYRLIDFKKEQADLTSKERIVEDYLKYISATNKSKVESVADAVGNVIRILAEPYSDRRGYRTTWRPSR